MVRIDCLNFENKNINLAQIKPHFIKYHSLTLNFKRDFKTRVVTLTNIV